MIERNRLANITNQHQGPLLKVLCVCSAGLLRSPTAANVLHNKYGYNTRAVGCENSFSVFQLEPIHLAWADEIVVMDQHQKEIVEKLAMSLEDEIGYCSEHTKGKVVCLNIPDVFGYNDPELKQIIIDKYEEVVGID